MRIIGTDTDDDDVRLSKTECRIAQAYRAAYDVFLKALDAADPYYITSNLNAYDPYISLDACVGILKGLRECDEALIAFQTARRELETCGFMDRARERYADELAEQERRAAERRRKIAEKAERLRKAKEKKEREIYEKLKAKFEAEKKE